LRDPYGRWRRKFSASRYGEYSCPFYRESRNFAGTGRDAIEADGIAKQVSYSRAPKQRSACKVSYRQPIEGPFAAIGDCHVRRTVKFGEFEPLKAPASTQGKGVSGFGVFR
jgi:hypothetical protein